MNHDYQQIIRQHCRPLSPLPTAISKRLVRLPDVRAVVFDVYGTLIISSSGDVGANLGLCVTGRWKVPMGGGR